MEDLKKYKSDKPHLSYNATVDFSTKSDNFEVIFRGVKDKLIDMIKATEERDFILCAVAWFTDFDILKQLKKAQERKVLVLIVLQKEDYLRPDFKTTTEWSNNLRNLYKSFDKVDMGYNSYFADILYSAKDCIDERSSPAFYEDDVDILPIRCVGNNNQDKNPSHPRMHNKFIVFGCMKNDKPQPGKVWTGSYNISRSAENSFENVVIIKKCNIANAYLKEFSLIFLLSEKLDWKSVWMKPEISYET
eukprot:gene12931-7512_t